MKKIILSLLLIANSLFAVTTAEVMESGYPRAMITQIDIRDQGEYGTKLNVVDYTYWTASYPYDTLKYNGKIENWVYTFSDDYNDFYSYTYHWDSWVNPNDLSVTYIYVNLQGYSSNNVYVTRSDDTAVPFSKTLSNGFRVYKDVGSSAIRSYKVKTYIQATDGSADLYNNVSIDRDVK